MKLIAIFISSIFLSSSVCFGQNSKPITVPVLKENKQIDSIMDIALTSQRMKLSDSVNRCFLITMITINDNYLAFEIGPSSKMYIDSVINRAFYKGFEYGYFPLMNQKIFAWTKSDFHGFLIKTNSIATFRFISRSDINYKFPQNLAHPWFHFKYVDGHITQENPPPIVKIIK